MGNARHDRHPRLFVDNELSTGSPVTLTAGQAHYLVNVMRLSAGDGVRLFNGRDGEWLAAISEARRKTCVVTCKEKLREQTGPPDIHYLFAPLKQARLDFMAQKATEMGVAVLQPVMTERTVPQRVNLQRIRANTIEAAEQCHLLSIPSVEPPTALDTLLSRWESSRLILYCDETAERASPLERLRQVNSESLAVLVGPEGGFSDVESTRLRALDFVIPLHLGPRIIRADTAAIAALALVQATCGDWR